MELKGKLLKDFWSWYLEEEQKVKFKTNSLLKGNPAIKIRFMAMSLSDRWGVYQLFADNVKGPLEVYSRETSQGQFYTSVYDYEFKGYDEVNWFPSREEAWLEALKQFSTWYKNK